jgi:hypothetical protein
VARLLEHRRMRSSKLLCKTEQIFLLGMLFRLLNLRPLTQCVHHRFITLQHDLFEITVDLAVGYTLDAALSHQPKFAVSYQLYAGRSPSIPNKFLAATRRKMCWSSRWQSLPRDHWQCHFPLQESHRRWRRY